MKTRRFANKPKSFLNKDIESKSIQEFFLEFLKINKPEASISSSQTSLNDTAKVDFLKAFLSKLKSTFNSSANVDNHVIELKNEDKILFEKELHINSKEIVVVLTFNLIQSHSVAVRLISIHVILCLTHFKKFHEAFQEINLSSFIVRIIDSDLTIDETALAIEYIRLLSQLYPTCINATHFYCLISAVEDQNYLLNNYILETLLELICKRPKIACECQVFDELINYVVNFCNENDFCIELIMQTLIKCMDNAEFRQMVNLSDLFKTLLAPLVDCDYTPLLYGGSSHKNNHCENSHNQEPKIKNIVNSCYTALSTIFTSYTGIMCFSVNDGENFRTLLSPLSWFLKANIRNLNKESILSASSDSSSPLASQNTKSKAEQAISRQILLLNELLNFLYNLFKIDQIDPQDLVDKAKNSRSGSNVSSTNSSQANDSINDEFVNSECSDLFETIENFSTQSNNLDLDEDHRLKVYSTSPNLTISFRSFLVKAFAESSLFECLLDLYFGLPVSFLQNYSLAKYDLKPNNLYSVYQSLSLRCLNLLAEMYYWMISKLDIEYCIDDFTQNKNSSSPFSSNQTVYDEMKRLSLISYLKELVEQTKDFEREKEVITYMTEFSSKKESIKNGVMLPTDSISKVSFFSQQFLVNSYYLSSKKFEIELEIFKSNKAHIKSSFDDTETTQQMFDFLFAETKKEHKRRLVETEKSLDEHFDLTLILQLDANVANQDSKNWNWFEIVRMFEIFLLTSSSMHPKFAPTQDAIFIDNNKKTLIIENQKLVKIIRRLLEYFIVTTGNETLSSASLSSSPSKNSTPRSKSHSISQHQNSSVVSTDLIACSGCYLLDFVLHQFNLKNLSEKILNRADLNRILSSYEYLFVYFIQSMKLYLSNEYSIKSHASKSLVNNRNGSNIAKDSAVSYYILFIGHLSSCEKGDKVLESFKIYDLILRIIETHKNLTLMKLTVSTLNYYVSSKARLILNKCLCISPNEYSSNESREEYNEFKIYTIKLISNIFRANNLKFEVFFLEIILNSLIISESWYNEVNRTNSSSNQILLEMCLNLIEYLVNLRPDFIDSLLKLNSLTIQAINTLKDLIGANRKNSKILKIKIKLLLYRFRLSSKRLDILKIDEFETILNEWDDDDMDYKYFKLVERYLFDANAINQYFTNDFDDRNEIEQHIDIESEEIKSNYKVYRKMNDSSKNYTSYLSSKAQTYLPFHINKAVIRYGHFIAKNFYISEKFTKKVLSHLDTIKLNILNMKFNPKKNDWINGKQVKALKTALWSIGSFLICENGFKYISILNNQIKLFQNLFEFITFLVKIVEDHPVLSVRATALHTLNLICKSSTGANLIGKLGWHTFQPKRITAEKTFYTIFNTLSSEQQKPTGIGSSIDTAVQLFNTYRSKSDLVLREIKKYFYYDLSTFENDYLNEANKCDILAKNDLVFIKNDDMNRICLFFDNITVPIRFTLLSVVQEINTRDFLENKLRLIQFSNRCTFKDCFYCYLNQNGFFSSVKFLGNHNNRKQHEIIHLINQLTPMINMEKKLPHLSELRHSSPKEFDMCLHCLITQKFLSCCKIKYPLRKFIQELFTNMNHYVSLNNDLT